MASASLGTVGKGWASRMHEGGSNQVSIPKDCSRDWCTGQGGAQGEMKAMDLPEPRTVKSESNLRSKIRTTQDGNSDGAGDGRRS